MEVKWTLKYWSGYEWIYLKDFIIEIPEDDFTACETQEERDALIDYYIKKDYEIKINWERS